MSSNLDIAKEIIKKKFLKGCCGIFNTRNVLNDSMTTLYDKDGLQVDICYPECYFEVFGLTDDEFAELEKYYKSFDRDEEFDKEYEKKYSGLDFKTGVNKIFKNALNPEEDDE